MVGNKPVRKYMVTGRRMQANNRNAGRSWNYVPSSEHISDVDVDSMGRRTVAWVIERIRSQEASFFMYVGLERVVLQVVERAGTPFLRAEHSEDSADHLLALPVFT